MAVACVTAEHLIAAGVQLHARTRVFYSHILPERAGAIRAQYLNTSLIIASHQLSTRARLKGRTPRHVIGHTIVDIEVIYILQQWPALIMHRKQVANVAYTRASGCQRAARQTGRCRQTFSDQTIRYGDIVRFKQVEAIVITPVQRAVVQPPAFHLVKQKRTMATVIGSGGPIGARSDMLPDVSVGSDVDQPFVAGTVSAANLNTGRRSLP